MDSEELKDQFADQENELNDLWLKLKDLPEEPADSPAMRTRFRAALDAYQEGMRQGSTPWQRMGWWISSWWPQQPVVQLGIALVLLASGVIAGRYLAPGEVPQQQQTRVQELDQLRGELRNLREVVVLSLMQQQSATDRLRGVNWSNQIEEPDNKILTALLDMLMHDPNVNVRLASVEALRKFGEQQIVRQGALQALEQQESPLIQMALIDFMVEQQEKESIGTLQRLAGDSSVNETVRQRAALGVEDFQQRQQ